MKALRCWFHWEPEAFSEPPSLEAARGITESSHQISSPGQAWCVPNYSENWERWESGTLGTLGTLETLETLETQSFCMSGISEREL